MVVVDFAGIGAFFFSTVLSLVYISWIFYNWKEKTCVDYLTDYLYHCPYCTQVFYVYQAQSYYQCPKCGSLIQREQISNVKNPPA